MLGADPIDRRSDIQKPGFYLSPMTRLTDGDWEYAGDWKGHILEVLPQRKLPPKLNGFNYRLPGRLIRSLSKMGAQFQSTASARQLGDRLSRRRITAFFSLSLESG